MAKNHIPIEDAMNHEVNNRLKPAFDDIRNYLPRQDRIIMTNPQDYDGWVDALEPHHYFSIFDKRYEKGRELAKLVRKRKTGLCEFQPFPDFKVSGKLLAHKSTDGLEWIVIALE